MATITLTMRHTRHEGTGLSTDTKPSANYDDRIYETDTGDEYKCFGGDDWVRISTGGAGHVDASPNSYAVTQHDSTADANGPFIGVRFDAAGAVSLVSGNGAVHALTVLAGEYWPGTVLRINDTGTALTNAQMVGFKRT